MIHRDNRRAIDFGLGQTAPVVPKQPVGYAAPTAVQQQQFQMQAQAIPPAQLAAKVVDEIKFWSQALSDNSYLLYTGLEEATLKRDALGFQQQWDEFRKTRLPEGAVSIDSARVLAGEYRNLLTNFRNFLSHVYERANAGEWIGWLYPLWLDSMRRSLDYGIASLDRADAGRARAPAQARAEETCTWTRLMLDASVLIAHLLDPSEANMIAQARNFGMQFGRLSSACNSGDPHVLATVEKLTAQFLAWVKGSGIGTAKVKSTISPVLAVYFARNAERFLQVINSAKAGRLI